MARKYDLISELYDRTCASVSENPLNWQGLLRTASYNFRLRFDEQLLLYAQRPDATAVLPIERWNGSFGRWVNRGAKGIAVFEDENRQRQRLTHYFDISDTHGSRYARPVPLWQMKPEYESDVAETLENTFGDVWMHAPMQVPVSQLSGTEFHNLLECGLHSKPVFVLGSGAPQVLH